MNGVLTLGHGSISNFMLFWNLNMGNLRGLQRWGTKKQSVGILVCRSCSCRAFCICRSSCLLRQMKWMTSSRSHRCIESMVFGCGVESMELISGAVPIMGDALFLGLALWNFRLKTFRWAGPGHDFVPSCDVARKVRLRCSVNRYFHFLSDRECPLRLGGSVLLTN
jgi:hypothetical protein